MNTILQRPVQRLSGPSCSMTLSNQSRLTLRIASKAPRLARPFSPLNNARSRARISFVPPFHYCRQTLRHLSKQREYAAQISCLNAPRSDTILQATVQRIAGPSRLSTTAARPYLSKQREYAATKACLNAPRIDTILQKPVRRIAGPSCLSTTAARPYLSKQREHAAQPACLNAPRIITLQAYTQIWVDVGVANSQALGFTGAPEVY